MRKLYQSLAIGSTLLIGLGVGYFVGGICEKDRASRCIDTSAKMFMHGRTFGKLEKRKEIRDEFLLRRDSVLEKLEEWRQREIHLDQEELQELSRDAYGYNLALDVLNGMSEERYFSE